mmetsp:Transcript_8222/g.18387  ORF Transcript_8222/g.18387 Transcript_8222/m.18387 type:complete len:227 (+) Transcript_8222:308-988(+)
MRDAQPSELLGLSLCHTLPPLLIHKSGDVPRATSTHGDRRFHQCAAQWNIINLTLALLIPASNDETCHEIVLVVVSNQTEKASSRIHCWWTSQLHRVLPQVVLDEAGEGLCVCSAAGTAHEDFVVHLGDLPCISLRNVVTCGCPRIGCQADPTIIFDCHNGRSCGYSLLGLHHIIFTVRAARLDVLDWWNTTWWHAMVSLTKGAQVVAANKGSHGDQLGQGCNGYA